MIDERGPHCEPDVALRQARGRCGGIPIQRARSLAQGIYSIGIGTERDVRAGGSVACDRLGERAEAEHVGPIAARRPRRKTLVESAVAGLTARRKPELLNDVSDLVRQNAERLRS